MERRRYLDPQPSQGAPGGAGLDPVGPADRVGISRQAVISIEKYKYTPSLELAFKIAQAFQVPIQEVFEYKEDDKNE